MDFEDEGDYEEDNAVQEEEPIDLDDPALDLDPHSEPTVKKHEPQLQYPDGAETEDEAINNIKETIEDTTPMDSSITAAFDGKQYAIFKGSKVIATIAKDDVSESVAKVFGTRSFLPALQAAIQANRTEGYGLKKVSVVLDDSHINKKIEAAVAKEKEDMRANFEQAMSIAAAGQVKGMFKAPLFDAMEKELTALGVANAASIVSRLVATAGPSQMDILVNEATHLLDSSKDERNTLAKKLLRTTTEASVSNDVATPAPAQRIDRVVSKSNAPHTEAPIKKFGTLFPTTPV